MGVVCCHMHRTASFSEIVISIAVLLFECLIKQVCQLAHFPLFFYSSGQKPVFVLQCRLVCNEHSKYVGAGCNISWG